MRVSRSVAVCLLLGQLLYACDWRDEELVQTVQLCAAVRALMLAPTTGSVLIVPVREAFNPALGICSANNPTHGRTLKQRVKAQSSAPTPSTLLLQVWLDGLVLRWSCTASRSCSCHPPGLRPPPKKPNPLHLALTTKLHHKDPCHMAKRRKCMQMH
jgi:hypothetical protein